MLMKNSVSRQDLPESWDRVDPPGGTGSRRHGGSKRFDGAAVCFLERCEADGVGLGIPRQTQEYGQITEAKERLAEQKLYLEDEIRIEHSLEEIIGNSPRLKAVLESVRIVAPADSTVLIQGETGTGKEMIARAIHNLGSRKGQAFVK